MCEMTEQETIDLKVLDWIKKHSKEVDRVELTKDTDGVDDVVIFYKFSGRLNRRMVDTIIRNSKLESDGQSFGKWNWNDVIFELPVYKGDNAPVIARFNNQREIIERMENEN